MCNLKYGEVKHMLTLCQLTLLSYSNPIPLHLYQKVIIKIVNISCEIFHRIKDEVEQMLTLCQLTASLYSKPTAVAPWLKSYDNKRKHSLRTFPQNER